MSTSELKLYKELKNIEKFGTTKLEKTINLPIEQNVYASFFDVSKEMISKEVKAFEKHKRDVLCKDLGA